MFIGLPLYVSVCDVLYTVCMCNQQLCTIFQVECVFMTCYVLILYRYICVKSLMIVVVDIGC